MNFSTIVSSKSNEKELEASEAGSKFLSRVKRFSEEGIRRAESVFDASARGFIFFNKH